MAIYYSGNSQQWNLFGLDQVGQINADGSKWFYLKDHLGSVRAVLDDHSNVISANDYDCWGYTLDSRSFTKLGLADERYKFTGKEHDNENGYDYFEARYYSSRIGRWPRWNHCKISI